MSKYLGTMRKSPKETKNKIEELQHFSDNSVIRVDTVNERASKIRYMPTNFLP